MWPPARIALLCSITKHCAPPSLTINQVATQLSPRSGRELADLIELAILCHEAVYYYYYYYWHQ